MTKSWAWLTLSLIPLFSHAAEARSFPKGFRWCVATAAHQIEGHNVHSDWWQFENEPGNIKNSERSGAACDHWNRLEEDTQLLKELHVSTYRFSIEWAKIEPREGHWDFEALRHYQKEIDLLRKSGIEPMITLMHFTLPAWVAEHGGWEWSDAPKAFGRYVDFVYSALGAGIRDWITFNEPMTAAAGGYFSGVFPPKKKNDLPATINVMEGMLRAHVKGYRAIHRLAPTISPHLPVRVGFAHHLRVMDPGWSLNPIEIWATHKIDEAWNWAFSEAPETGRLVVDLPFLGSADRTIPGLKGTQDFIGVNYYSRDIIRLTSEFPYIKQSPNENAAGVSDLGWEIYPEGMYRILKTVSERFPGKRIFITENGIADADDSKRAKFIQDHLREVLRAIDDGVPIDGYCHWSLMDNFEWAEGFTPRFGLYAVNYSTQKRTPRNSARIFSRICESNALE